MKYEEGQQHTGEKNRPLLFLNRIKKSLQAYFEGSVEKTKPFKVIDLTQTAKRLEIKTEYPGNDDEKRDFKMTGTELLSGKRLLAFSKEQTLEDSPFVLVAKDKLGSVNDVKRMLRQQLDQSSQVPCYFDREAKKLVVFFAEVYGEVHHGVESGTHRDTYNAVILSRALAVAKEKEVDRHEEENNSGSSKKDTILSAIIKNPSEFQDGSVLSCNIYKRDESYVIDLFSSTISEDILQLLSELNVITLDQYIQEVANTNGEGRSQVELILGENINASVLAKNLLNYFYWEATSAYWREDSGGIVFSPGILIGDQVDYRYKSWSVFRHSDFYYNNKETYDMYAELLLSGESIPLSIVAYKNKKNGNIKYVVSDNHPDAARFFSSVANLGDMGFANRYAVADLVGELSIDMEKLKTMHNESDDDGNPLIPMKILITGANPVPLEKNLVSEDHVLTMPPTREGWQKHFDQQVVVNRKGQIRLELAPDFFSGE